MDASQGEEPQWLTAQQSAAWVAWMRLQLRMNLEIGRQLQRDSGLSLADWDVLAALSAAAEPMAVTSLALQIGWERSRTSHHLQRMRDRGLVDLAPSVDDRRVTTATLTTLGRRASERAAPAHVAFIREIFFDGIDPALLGSLTQALQQAFEHIVERGRSDPRA